ncbi:hypothetical protein ACLKA7_008051 [Drosophila subpalustris]
MLAGRQALPLPLPLPLTAFPKVDYKLKALVIAALSQHPAASTGVACLLLNSPILGIPNDLPSALLASSFHLARRRPARSVGLWCEMEWPGGHCVVQLPVACFVVHWTPGRLDAAGAASSVMPVHYYR